MTLTMRKRREVAEFHDSQLHDVCLCISRLTESVMDCKLLEGRTHLLGEKVVHNELIRMCMYGNQLKEIYLRGCTPEDNQDIINIFVIILQKAWYIKCWLHGTTIALGPHRKKMQHRYDNALEAVCELIQYIMDGPVEDIASDLF